MKGIDALLAESSDPKNNRAREREATMKAGADAILASALELITVKIEGMTTRSQSRLRKEAEKVSLRPARLRNDPIICTVDWRNYS